MTAIKKILITGGAGFIGYHLSSLLSAQEGYQIDILDNFQRGMMDDELKHLLANGKVRLIERNLLSKGWQNVIERDYQYIYHLAAIIGVTHVQKRPLEVLQNNTLMLIGIIDLCREQKDLKRLIFASTSEVYAGTLKHFNMEIPTPETTPLALTGLDLPRTSYMLSKIYGEALCHHSGLPFTIVRPHNLFGPRMGLSHVIPELLQLAHVTPLPGVLDVFSADHKRTFCYIRDAVRMMRAVGEMQECAGQTFNIGNQSPEYTMKDVAKIVLRTVGKDLKIKPGESAAGSPVRRAPDMSKTFRMTGYVPEVDLEKGIALTYSWYREKIFNGKQESAR